MRRAQGFHRGRKGISYVMVAFVTVLVVAPTSYTALVFGGQRASQNNAATVAAATVARPVIENFVAGPGCKSFPGLKLQNGETSLVSFLMQQNSSASICVSYTFNPVQTQTLVNFQDYAYLFIVTANAVSNEYGDGFSYSKVPAPGISVGANPSSITLVPGVSTPTQVVVQYTISASSTSKGFFSLNYLDSCPAFIPVSVGYGTTDINASDYHGFFLSSNCVWAITPITGTPQVVGYGGMGTTLVTAGSEMT